MAEPAHAVVERLAGREGLVAALVRQDPQTRAEDALDHSVPRPQGRPQCVRRHVLGCAVGVEDVEDAGQRSQISRHVSEPADGGALEAVLGDGVTDVLDCVVGHLELVAVRIEQHLLGHLVGLFHGAEGGQRGG